MIFKQITDNSGKRLRVKIVMRIRLRLLLSYYIYAKPIGTKKVNIRVREVFLLIYYDLIVIRVYGKGEKMLRTVCDIFDNQSCWTSSFEPPELHLICGFGSTKKPRTLSAINIKLTY
jgi:hypothetical protein